MTFEQQWLEYDYNPFVVFNANGKITSLNSEAQFLLGSTTDRELYELASSYANITFGFKTTFIDLEFGRYKFFGLTVGYENEDEIAIKLYQAPSFKIDKPKPGGELTNIYTLVDLCIATNSISSQINYKKEFDPTIPDIIINSNNFIKLLNKVYACFEDNTTVKTKIFYRIGEHIKFEEKKYSLFSIQVNAENQDSSRLKELELFTQSSEFYVDTRNSITINIPMITS